MKKGIEKATILISEIISMNKFYNDGIKKLSIEYLYSIDHMKGILEGTINPPILEKKNFKTDVIKFLYEYELLVLDLVDEINIADLGLEQIKGFVLYMDTLEPNQIKNLYSKTIEDIVLFLNFLHTINRSPESIPKDVIEFSRKFKDSLSK